MTECPELAELSEIREKAIHVCKCINSECKAILAAWEYDPKMEKLLTEIQEEVQT